MNQPNKYLSACLVVLHLEGGQDRFGTYFPCSSSLADCQPRKAKALVKHRATLQTGFTPRLLLQTEFNYLTPALGRRSKVTP